MSNEFLGMKTGVKFLGNGLPSKITMGLCWIGLLGLTLALSMAEFTSSGLETN